MIKGLSITPPIVGRISIGRVVEKNGKRLPEKDDQFTITTQIQNKDGWVLHPLDKALRVKGREGRKSSDDSKSVDKAFSKLRAIPVHCLFDAPELNLRAEYSCFDRTTGRPLCVGDGEQCQRVTENGTESLPCPSPQQCEFGKGGLCKPYGRLHVQIGDDDDVGSFVFRTTGFNSIRTLSARLNYYHAVSGGLLSCMPLELRLRGKSTTQSFRQAIYYVDLVVREGLSLQEAVKQARETHEQRQSAGIQQNALDAAARVGFANGQFECGDEEGAEVVEEFYSASVSDDSALSEPISNDGLMAKLDKQVQRQEVH